MKVTSAAKVGFTVVLVVVVLVFIYKGLGWTLPFTTPARGNYPVYANFISVKGLNRGADVQLNGNYVGEVGDITNDGFGGVQVALLIRDGQIIHDHADFTISRDSIFGSYMVMISESRAGRMTSGISGGEFTVRVAEGSVDEGGLVVIRDEETGEVVTIGQILAVDECGSLSECVRVSSPNGAVLDEDMAFVPTRFTSDGPRGFIIHNALEPRDVVSGTRDPGPEDLVATADVALRDVTGQVTIILEQFSSLLDNIEQLLGPEDFQNLFETLTDEISTISEGIVDLTGQLNAILADSRPYIEGTFENIEGMTSDAREMIAGFSEYNDPEVRKNITDLVENLSVASEQLVSILEDVEAYTSDEELREDISGSISEARAAITDARSTLDLANEAITGATDTMGTMTSIDTGADLTVRYNNDTERWASDFNFWVGMEDLPGYVTAGIDDIGETDRVNAQFGWRFDDSVSARVGARRGKLGVGIDWEAEAFRVVSDLYDPNDLSWNVYAGYAVFPQIDLMVGVEDLLEEEELNLALSFRF